MNHKKALSNSISHQKKHIDMLSKTAQKWLDRINEIQQEIRELYLELEKKLGGETEALSPKNLDAAIDRMKKETRIKTMVVGRKRGDPCKECGSTGTRHFKTCSQVKKPPKLLYTVPPLTADQYDELRDAMFEKDFQSMPYALTHKMSPKEVNLAVQTTSYADYLNKRKTV